MREQMKPVYKNMKEDPAYQGEGNEFIDFKGSMFGYTMALKKDGKIIGMCGEDAEVPYLEVGNEVKPKLEGLYGFDSNETAEIVDFREPNVDGNTDHVVKIKQGEKVAWVKPYQMEKIY